MTTSDAPSAQIEKGASAPWLPVVLSFGWGMLLAGAALLGMAGRQGDDMSRVVPLLAMAVIGSVAIGRSRNVGGKSSVAMIVGVVVISFAFVILNG